MHVLMKFDTNFFDWHNGGKMQFYMASYKTDVTFYSNQWSKITIDKKKKTTTDNFIRSCMTSWPCYLKKTSSMQLKHHDPHHTWLHHETNEKQFILVFADFMTQILWEHFFLFLSKTKNNFYFLILLVKLSAIWFVICTNIITAVWQVYGPSAATFFRLVYFALSRFVSMSNNLKLEFFFLSILSSKIICA